ncbi:MAG: hypothetical protein Q4G70_01950 [Pseudomonadota bacterium]|nr:hypothetical protein [Pseudomonadota bacterium]
MSVLPARRPPDDSPADWRVLALAAAPPLVVLTLRVLMPGQPEGDGLYPLEAASMVSDPGQAFWLAARPLVYGVLVIAAVLGGLWLAVRRLGWPRVRPAVLALWVLMWVAMGAWLVTSEMNRAGRQPLPEQAAKVLLSREMQPTKRRAGGTEVYFERQGDATPQRLFVEDAPVAAFAPGSIARLHAHAGRWWGQWGRLEPRLDFSRPPASAPAGSPPGG